MAILSSSTTPLRTVEQLKAAYEEAFEATRAAWDAYMAASAAWQEALETPIFATTRAAWRARVDEARMASNAAGEHFHQCMDIEARTRGERNLCAALVTLDGLADKLGIQVKTPDGEPVGA